MIRPHQICFMAYNSGCTRIEYIYIYISVHIKWGGRLGPNTMVMTRCFPSLDAIVKAAHGCWSHTARDWGGGARRWWVRPIIEAINCESVVLSATAIINQIMRDCRFGLAPLSTLSSMNCRPLAYSPHISCDAYNMYLVTWRLMCQSTWERNVCGIGMWTPLKVADDIFERANFVYYTNMMSRRHHMLNLKGFSHALCESDT